MRRRPLAAFAVLMLLPLAAAAQSFTNVTTDAGLDGLQAFRISVGDLNGDGYADIFVHLEPTHDTGDVEDKQLLYLNEPGALPGDRVFVDRTTGSGIRANRPGTTTNRHSDAAIFGDADNDGDLDVFTTVYLHRNYTLNKGTNDLLLNDGNAVFTLAANSTFHTEENWNTPAAVFVDYDNDSNLDLYIGTWYKPDSTMNIDRLYKGDGSGGFTDVTVAAGIDAETTCVYAVAAFDWDDDGDMDLFAPPYSRTVLISEPRQWRNNGDGTFTQVAPSTNYDPYRGLLGQKVSFGTIPRDWNNDGRIDFFELMTHGDGAGATGVHSTVVSNPPSGVFSWDFGSMSGRENEDTDITHDGDHYAAWFDYNGDMLVDFVVTESGYNNPGLYLFTQQMDHTFVASTVGSGLDEVNTQAWSPGYVTPVDYDLDGDEDLLVTTNTGLKLYRNDVGNAKNWIAIKLRGVGAPGFANTSAIGAKVQVTAGGVTQTQEVYAGNGHEGPMRPLTLYFGLDTAGIIDSIDVRWPNTTLTTQQLTDVAVNQFLTIDEPCSPGAPAPDGLLVDRDGDDLVLTWDDPLTGGVTWNVYRDGVPDPSGWPGPHAQGVSDEDPGTPGIQYRDVGAAIDPSRWFYLVTAENVCGETPLR
jgi:hypothetical protein